MKFEESIQLQPNLLGPRKYEKVLPTNYLLDAKRSPQIDIFKYFKKSIPHYNTLFNIKMSKR
jgi:hypothetical protein